MDQYLGEIRLFGFNFAPYGWFQCLGQILPISQYSALFSLLGTNFGGNGTSNFQLPNLQNNVLIGQGAGPGLTPFSVGETAGLSDVTLTTATMPMHPHGMTVASTNGTTNLPTAGASIAQGHGGSGPAAFRINLFTTQPPGTTLNPLIVGLSGGSQPHNNTQPTLVMNWCISYSGTFPSRN